MKILERLEYFKDHPYAGAGYPQYAVTADGCVLSHSAILEQWRLIKQATEEPGTDKQWEVIRIGINWEDDYLYCDHTGEKIESAYGEWCMKIIQFTVTPKGYYYLDSKRVSKEQYTLAEIMCHSFDSILSIKGYQYKTGRK